MTQEEKISHYLNELSNIDKQLKMFYQWLQDHEILFLKEKDEDSVRLIQSIKSMFIDIFGHYYATK